MSYLQFKNQMIFIYYYFMNYLKISLGIFIVLAASRFIPHPPNFTSLIALSFYVPLFLGKRFISVLLICFMITDLFIGFHNTLVFTWGSIILIGLTSHLFQKYFLKNYRGCMWFFNFLYNFKFWCVESRIIRIFN